MCLLDLVRFAGPRSARVTWVPVNLDGARPNLLTDMCPACYNGSLNCECPLSSVVKAGKGSSVRRHSWVDPAIRSP